ncbi:hypothetical protein N7510_004784 [Penicillium lagena]|uniref:uncharacterized protein n=1 Tax=Penicillium lagena TaxID=94218 RepID=UPI0025420320|nr:uncharacterized protein N7510_004784 [Penicillium lagena]KAJ5620800.1 hypothetical protein N7510_004784 [Penicillium lagena]
MSNYHVGPFGRMLPTADEAPSEQQPERSANLAAHGNNPYQLPPPRNLQFGSDQYMRQRQAPESSEPAASLPLADTGSQRRQTEQLPSVRQLLTPTTGSSSPQPYYSQPFGVPAPALERRDHTYTFRQHESSLSSHVSPSEGLSEPLSQSHIGSLPRLARVTMQSPGEIKHHAVTRSDSSVPSFQHSQLPVQGTIFHEKAASDMSSPETTNRPHRRSVRPHVVDERYIEGEGICYVYADGSHCPKAVDGIPVNANWGVTKAGRPRKRLAQACLTCREKKIKCQPNLPKCDQCQKSGRECRFESAPRGGRGSLKGSQSGPASKEGFSPVGHTGSDVSPSMYNIVRGSNSSTSLAGTSGHSPISEGPSMGETTYETMAEADRAYRSRMHRIPPSSSISGDTSTRQPESAEPDRLPEYSDVLRELKDADPDDPLVKSWNLDPYDADPEITTRLVDCYFSHINNGLYHMFPHTRFMLWLRSCHTKSTEDKMLLYSMMALGSVFSEHPDNVVSFRRYSRIARFAISRNQYSLSLQLAQSHLIMSLWYYATGSLVGCWDSIGAAGRAVYGLRYNVESGGVVLDQSHACEYGLHPQALIECRRRTFWATFMLDRFSSLYSASSTLMSSESALLRLPCQEDVYETQQYATAPYFQTILNQTPSETEDNRSVLSAMAILIEILAYWGDVSLHVFRLPHIPSEAYGRLAEEFHESIYRQTSDWIVRLPEHLVFSVINLEQSIRTKQADTFISIHMLYHGTLMKLYRHARYQSLRAEVLDQYIRRARFHAVEILKIALAFDQYADEIESSRSNADPMSPSVTFLNPFLGYIILMAVDVLSAAGLTSELSDCVSLIRGALGALKKLSRYWDSSLLLVSSLQRRTAAMADCLNDRVRMEETLGFALDGPSLEAKVHAGTLPSQFPGSHSEDLFLGAMPREYLLNAMRVDDISFPPGSIIWIKDQ